MIKRGTQSRRGRKPAPCLSSALVKEESDVAKTILSSTTPIRKTRAAFRGKLSHTSPTLNSLPRENKITVYFGAKNGDTSDSNCVAQEDNGAEITKSIALKMVFCKSQTSETSPHKILLKKEAKSETSETALKTPIEEIQIMESQAPKPKSTKVTAKLNNNQSLNKDPSQNHKLTEYFTVRRSVRKPKNVILEEKQKCLEDAVLSENEDGLQIHVFPGKGRGIIASRLFRKGEFVVEYSGDLIDLNEAKKREQLYAADQNTGCYMYYFQHKSQSYCVDATAESPRFGRLVNHSRSGNLAPKIIEIEDRPHLLLVARFDILPGKELLYDYGDRSSLSLKYHPWLAS